MGRDKYPVTNTLSLDILSAHKVGFVENRNHQLMKIAGLEEDATTKSAQDKPLLNIKE